MFEISTLGGIDNPYEERVTGFVYSRDPNSHVVNLENTIAQLEGTDDQAGFASGVAIIGNVLLSMLKAGDHALATSRRGSKPTLHHPANTSHSSLNREQQRALEIEVGLIRMSCG